MTQLYDKRLSRRYPGLFVILIDQSGSMSQGISGQQGLNKADFAASALNALIYAMIKEGKYDPTTGQPRKYAYISIFGYGSTVDGLLTQVGNPIDIAFLSSNPLRYETIERDELNNSTGQYERVTDHIPIWIEPRASGTTEMAQALSRAAQVVRDWLAMSPEPNQGSRQDGFPPIVINITDGEHQGSGDPLQAAMEVTAQQTSYGNVLLYSCHFTNDMLSATIFPSGVEQVMHLNPFAGPLFQMSSPIPDILLPKAQAINGGRPVPSGARGMIYNSDATLLVRFLSWGTIGTAGVE